MSHYLYPLSLSSRYLNCPISRTIGFDMENSLLLKVKTAPANGTYIRNICCREFLIPTMSSGFSGACKQLTISEMLRQYMCHIYSMDSFTLWGALFLSHMLARKSKKYSFGRISMFLDLIHSPMCNAVLWQQSHVRHMWRCVYGWMLQRDASKAVGLGYLTRCYVIIQETLGDYL